MKSPFATVTGTMCLKARKAFCGYAEIRMRLAIGNRPHKTAETMREGGWIFTGDRFVRDTERFHFFRGCADDLVKISGQWVHPLEVELCLAEHPMVRECAVLPIEGADRLTTLKAYVVLDNGSSGFEETTRGLQEALEAEMREEGLLNRRLSAGAPCAPNTSDRRPRR
jgi:acyl-coenzyme A synthetase/AMP-(fatty) acid ligase